MFFHLIQKEKKFLIWFPILPVVRWQLRHWYSVCFAVIHTDAWGVVGAAIYGSTMVVLYAMSSIYHGLKPEMPKKVFQVIDHCTIYFLIAGTYTPVTLTALRPQYPVQAFVIFGIVWACCFIAATLTAIDLKKYRFCR